MRAVVAALVALALAAPLSGCFGKSGGEEKEDAPAGQIRLGNETAQQISQLAAARPSRFQFTAPEAVPAERRVVQWMNGTIDSSANLAVESPQDRGGVSFNGLLQTQDFSAFVPAGQPTLVNARLWYDNKPGSSVDLDVFVSAHGVVTHAAPEYADEMTWTLPVKTASVATVGAADAPTLIGVQAANGRIAPGSSVTYWMRLEFLYGVDVAAPKVPYALSVPANASGLIVESVKFAGDTHVKGRFLVIGPDDSLVAAVAFDDIAIPTQSVFVPVPGPGEYVFYTVDAKNGFFAVRSDAPLDDHVARPLARAVTETVLITEPVAPGGVAEHALDAPVTPYQEGLSKDFTIDGAFPLEVVPFIQGEGATGDVELRVLSPTGLVAKYHRFARYDAAQGSVGVSDEDAGANAAFNPEFLARGPHKLSAVVNGMLGQAGVRVVTYAR